MSSHEWNPGELLEISGCYWKTCALHAGVKLDMFSIIGEKELTAENVVEKLNGDIDGIERLLNALTAMELLVKNRGKFQNSDGAKAFLVKRSPAFVGFMIMHHHHLMESWNWLDDSGIITGIAA
ncbi:MAG: methyltransferase dimerization domain-containing protein [Desulfobacterales bacterium]